MLPEYSSHAPDQSSYRASQRRCIAWTIWLAAALAPLSLSAGGATFLDAEYLIDSWETDQGLPENSATAMVQTPDGYLWFGTFGGLVRFDGVKFTAFDPSNTPTLPSDGIVNLHLDSSGRFWVSTKRGLVVSESNRWTAFRREATWTGDYARTFAENVGVVCITSFNGKVFQARQGRLEELPEPPGNKAGYFGYVDRQGSVWVAQDHFFGHWDGQRWVASEIAGAVTNGFKAATPARDGALLVCSTNQLLRIDDGQVLSRMGLGQDIGDVWRMNEDHQGTIWIGTMRKGLFAVSTAGMVRHFTATNGLTYDSVRFTFEDRESNLWVGGSGGGLMRFKRRTFMNYGSESGLDERNVKAVVEEAPGRMLIGTYGRGVSRLENGRASPLLDSSGKLHEAFVQCLLVDRQSRIWAGTYGNGLHMFDGQSWREIPSTNTGGVDIAALFQDSQGRLWIGGNQQVSVLADGVFQARASNASPASVHGFAEDPLDRTLWAATGDGLFRFDPVRFDSGSWQEIKEAGGKSVTGISRLHFDPDGTLWIATASTGVLRRRRGVWSAITEEHGLPARNITCLLEDGLGFVWLGSNRGVIRAARKDLERVADGTLTRLPCKVFNLSDGLASIECASAFQSTGLTDSQGQLWFATLKGAAMINPRTFHLDTNPPPIHLEMVSYIDRHGKKHRFTPESGVSLQASPGSRQFEAYFAVLSYSAPEKVKLEYRLMRDKKLLSVDDQRDRAIFSRFLAPGDYTLDVTAANNEGVWSGQGVTLGFTVLPFFWQTLWFRVLALTGLMGGVGFTAWGVTRNKLRRQIERLQQQRAIEQERARLASILETTSDFVGFADSQGRALFVNAAGRRMVGLDEHEDIRRHHIRDFHPAWATERLLTEGLPVALREGIWSGETAFVRRDGCEIPVSQVLVAHKEPDGTVSFLSTIARDITERKNAERALRESETRLRMLTDASLEGIGVCRNGVLVDANDQLAKMLGYARSEIIGKPIEVLIAPESREFVRRVTESQSTEPYQHFALRKDGSVFPVEVCARTILSDQQYIRVMSVRDIAERKRAEDAVRRSEELFRAIVEDQSEMIVRWKPDGTRTFVNQAYCRVFGQSREELVGTNLFPMVVEQERKATREKIHALTPANPVAIDVHRSVAATGEIHWQEWTDRGIFDTEGRLVELQSVGRDITERRKLEEQLRQIQKMESIGQLAGGVAHDFNNILTVIQGYAALLLAGSGSAGAVEESAEQIAMAAERAANLTRQLLLFSRKQVMQPRVLDLNEIVGNLTKMLTRILGEDISLNVSFSSNLPHIGADAGMMEQVLMNLAVNARDAMPDGGKLIITTAHEKISMEYQQANPQAAPGDHVCLSVSDTGCGISPEVLPRIFEPFFTTKGVGKGTGLGLATVYGIVQQHRGWITIDSEVGKGTAFHIYLPAVSGRDRKEALRTAEPEVRGGSETILFVEDEVAVRTLARNVLERCGYRVIEAASGVAAVKLWPEHRDRIDLLLTDMIMPDGMTGRQLAEKLRADKPSLPVIYSSGYSAEVVGEDFELREGINFLQKPYSLAKLAETVRSACDNQRIRSSGA